MQNGPWTETVTYGLRTVWLVNKQFENFFFLKFAKNVS